MGDVDDVLHPGLVVAGLVARERVRTGAARRRANCQEDVAASPATHFDAQGWRASVGQGARSTEQVALGQSDAEPDQGGALVLGWLPRSLCGKAHPSEKGSLHIDLGSISWGRITPADRPTLGLRGAAAHLPESPSYRHHAVRAGVEHRGRYGVIGTSGVTSGAGVVDGAGQIMIPGVSLGVVPGVVPSVTS
jgi:hypothetical protein